jgi:hypothetical protein
MMLWRRKACAHLIIVLHLGHATETNALRSKHERWWIGSDDAKYWPLHPTQTTERGAGAKLACFPVINALPSVFMSSWEKEARECRSPAKNEKQTRPRPGIAPLSSTADLSLYNRSHGNLPPPSHPLHNTRQLPSPKWQLRQMNVPSPSRCHCCCCRSSPSPSPSPSLNPMSCPSCCSSRCRCHCPPPASSSVP